MRWPIKRRQRRERELWSADRPGNFAVSGEIKNTESCRLSGTMTRNKDMISGVYDCGGLSEVGLMNMVRR
jgi:hypothetical protein